MVHELSTVKYFTGADAPPEPQRNVSSKWTKGIWATCLICCIAGAYGLIHGTMEVQRLLDGEPQKVTREGYDRDLFLYDREVRSFKKDYLSLLVFHRVIEFCVGGALLLGGALMMWRSPHARKVIFLACIAAIAFHLSTAMLKVFQFYSLREFFEEVGEFALRKSGVGGAQRDRALQHGLGGLGFGHALGVLFSLGFQTAIYIRMLLFVAQPYVREVFAEDPYPEMTEAEAEITAADAIAFAHAVRKAVTPHDAVATEDPEPAPSDADKFARI